MNQLAIFQNDNAARTPGEIGTSDIRQSHHAVDRRNCTKIDPLTSWYSLGAGVRKCKHGGAINLELAGLLVLAAVAGLLLAGVIW